MAPNFFILKVNGQIFEVGRGEGGPGRGERGLHGSCHIGRCAGDIRCAALPAIWIWSKRWPHNL